MRANRKSLIQRRFPVADTVRPDTRSVRADTFPGSSRFCRSAPGRDWAFPVTPVAPGWLLQGLLPRAVYNRPSQERSEEHTSELQSLMRITYDVICLNKKKHPSYL